ncbi:hypothetical protein [Paenibacillus glycanilyticus]|uniref:hypothetical protein n=1 Tax=Paenibacillus glycanilyticus TaxID=126569 RepID=UPI000FD82917|nr:hypothetical protein [Paenibacillus glycanilyticus]
MTPYELSVMVGEYVANEKRADRRAHETAYLSAYYQRVKKFPSYDKVFDDGKKSKPKKKKQTAAEMFAEVKRLHAVFNGTAN